MVATTRQVPLHNSSARPSRRGFLGAVAAGALGASGCSQGSASSGSVGSISALFLGASPATVELMQKTLIPQFETDSGVKVSLQQSDWGSGFQKVTTAAASGTLADVTMLGGIWVAPVASKGALLALDDHLADWADKANFYPGMLEDCTYDGKTYGLPLYSDTRTAVYRKDILAKVGVTEAQLPTTWAEYKELATELSSAKGGPQAITTDWFQDKAIGLQQSFAQLLFQNGGTYYDQDGKAQFASEQGVAALDYLMGFYREKLSDPNLIFQGSGPKPIVAGKVATTFSGFLDVANAEANDKSVTPQLIPGKPLTAQAGGKAATCGWINKLGVSAKSKNPEAAIKFVQFLVGKEVAPQLGANYGGLPARTDLADAEYLKGLNPGFAEASNYVVPQPPNPNMLTIAPAINTAIQQAVRLDGTPQQILADLDKKIDQLNGLT